MDDGRRKRTRGSRGGVGFTAIDLFSGCGGLTEGLLRAGFQVLGAVEIDENAATVYEANHSDVNLWREDIRRVSESVVRRTLGLRKGELDLLAGCPPCQGFSSLRTLNGRRSVRDARNDLVLEFLRFVKELMPKTVMMENVPGLADDARLQKLIGGLESLGYRTQYRLLDAACYGVPQRRVRLIMLASRIGDVEFGAPAGKQRTVRDAIGSLGAAGCSGDALHDLPERRSEKVRRLIRRIPRDGGSRTDLPRRCQLPCHRRCDGFKDVYGRMAWDGPAPTITSGCYNPSKGRFLHPKEDRSITLREAALLQGFPRRYRFPVHIGKEKLARMIGNALPPEFIRRHAMALAKHLTHNQENH